MSLQAPWPTEKTDITPHFASLFDLPMVMLLGSGELYLQECMAGCWRNTSVFSIENNKVYYVKF